MRNEGRKAAGGGSCLWRMRKARMRIRARIRSHGGRSFPGREEPVLLGWPLTALPGLLGLLLLLGRGSRSLPTYLVPSKQPASKQAKPEANRRPPHLHLPPASSLMHVHMLLLLLAGIISFPCLFAWARRLVDSLPMAQITTMHAGLGARTEAAKVGVGFNVTFCVWCSSSSPWSSSTVCSLLLQHYRAASTRIPISPPPSQHSPATQRTHIASSHAHT